MLNPEVAGPLAIALIAAVGLGFRLISHRERMARLRASESPDVGALGTDVNARLARLEQIVERMPELEQGVDAIAVEIERIGEGQRFLTTMLSERRLPGSGDARQ